MAQQSAPLREMSLVICALADALWPSNLQQVSANQQTDGAARYWQLSGADCPQIPLEVLKVIDNFLPSSDQQQLRLLLRLLHHKLPTLLLAGRYSLSLRPPFVRSVPEMSVKARQAALHSWAHSCLPILRKTYKALKSVIAAAVMSHIDPATGTNPFFEGVGYTPGHHFVDRDLGPEQPVAAVEELLATAIVDLPDVLSQGCDAEAYLNKRGFATLPAPAAETGAKELLRSGSKSSRPSSDAIHMYYDAVIVGSGAGGGVSSALLSSAGIRVLVLEKASWVRSKDMSWLEGEAHAEMYERAGFLTTHDAGVSILAGATLGGGTKINWTASLKTPDHVRQEWASAPHHLTHLGPDSPAYDAALNTVCSRLSVSTDTHMSAPNAKLLEGCQKLGFHAEQLPRNCLSKKCSAYCNFGCRSGHKQSSDVCWLIDAVRAGAHVLTGVEGRRVILKEQATGSKRKKVAGLVAVSSSKSRPAAPDNALPQCTLIIHAPIVVSSCGSIHTPALLLRSGVRVGGNVGRHLRLHPAAGMVGMFKQQAAAQEQAAAARGSIQMYQGVSMGAFSRDAANWTAGGYGAMVSVPAAHPGLLAVVSPDSQPGALKELLTHLPDVSCCVIFTRDSSSGRVEVDKEGQPVIKYWPCNQTLQHLLDGISLAARSLVAAGAIRILLPNFLHDWQLNLNPDDPLPNRMAQLENFLVRVRHDGVVKYSMPLLSAHQMGSCRMGSSPRISAVDPTGECWDVSGLYVADASLFPTASGVNPMITVYALSYLVASGIAARWKTAQKALKAAKTEAMDTDSIRDQGMVK